jgi:electron transport complex protein RnfB
MSASTANILAVLPQTQCTRCGYPDCAGYAQAVFDGLAGINQCPPGGLEGIERLAALTGKPLVPLSLLHGQEGPRTVAFVDEAWCIGCTLCIKACPVDAIVGTNKLMHTVVESLCTGCELCLPVCPVDCIELEVVCGGATGWAAWSADEALQAKTRYESGRIRRQSEALASEQALEEKAKLKLADLAHHSQYTNSDVLDKKQAVIAAALARARAK